MIDSIQKLTGRMKDLGAIKIYAKRLAPQDNSKNQLYLGSNYSALNVIPHGEVYTDGSLAAGSKRERAKAEIKFFWIDEHGLYHAPDAQFILYPKYPEVRMSGFLRNCERAPSDLMRPRLAGRVLFLGVTEIGQVLGYVVGPEHPLAKIAHRADHWAETGVLLRVPMAEAADASDKEMLFRELNRIHNAGWIEACRLTSSGREVYNARNAGGTTLEAELGIVANSSPDPDFRGWEVKQYGVVDFVGYSAKSPVTLITPEPDSGFYKDSGFEAFVRKYGYPDTSGVPDRINFGGIYKCGRQQHRLTGLRLELLGYCQDKHKIEDFDAGIALLDPHDSIAAMWSYSKLMDRWTRKHANAAYVPSVSKSNPQSFRFGSEIGVGESTDFALFLKAVSSGSVYLDPGGKIEGASSAKPVTHRRSQFRVSHGSLGSLYQAFSVESCVGQRNN